MTKYQIKQDKVRQEAIDWQHNFQSIKSWSEYVEAQRRFEKLAKRYGLVEEFRENCII